MYRAHLDLSYTHEAVEGVSAALVRASPGCRTLTARLRGLKALMDAERDESSHRCLATRAESEPRLH